MNADIPPLFLNASHYQNRAAKPVSYAKKNYVLKDRDSFVYRFEKNIVVGLGRFLKICKDMSWFFLISPKLIIDHLIAAIPKLVIAIFQGSLILLGLLYALLKKPFLWGGENVNFNHCKSISCSMCSQFPSDFLSIQTQENRILQPSKKRLEASHLHTVEESKGYSMLRFGC